MNENKPPYFAVLVIVLVLLGLIVTAAFYGDLLFLITSIGVIGLSLLTFWAFYKVMVYLLNKWDPS